MNEPMNDVDERIRAALHAAAHGIQERDLRPASPPQRVPRRHTAIRWAAPPLAAAAVVAVVLASIELSSGPKARPAVQPAGSASVSSKPAPTTTTTPSTAVKIPKPTPTSHPTTKSVPTGPTLLGYEPLWPFGSAAQAGAWAAANRRGGPASWHLDARQTALMFARDYLKFTDITQVTSTQITVKDAHIGVGYPAPSGQPHTAAVLHLLRFSNDAADTAAPWEVVAGTSTGFTLDPPSLSAARAVTAGGRITGVDENITVALRALGGGVETAAPIPAGGQNSPWSRTVPLAGLHGLLTVVASTGGHITAHERFVVIGFSVR